MVHHRRHHTDECDWYVPFWEQQSAHRSLPGSRKMYRMIACWSSRKPWLTLGPWRPLSSNAFIRAPSLLLTKTEIHAVISSSSSVWKWYVRLSDKRHHEEKKKENMVNRKYYFTPPFFSRFPFLIPRRHTHIHTKQTFNLERHATLLVVVLEPIR